jgi:hypothetical protein
VTTPAQQIVIGNHALLAIGALLGFVVIPPLARAAPQVVNWFLLLVLFGALIVNETRWLPWLTRLSQAARPSGHAEHPTPSVT